MASTGARVSPGPGVTIGGLMLLVCALLSLVSMAATQSAFLQVPAEFKPNLSIIWQLQDFATGKLGARESIGVIIAWGVELTTWVLFIAYEAAKDAVKNGNKNLVKLFETFMVGVSLWNIYTNYNYSALPGTLTVRLLYAAAITAFTFFFGVVGWKLVQDAGEDLCWWGK